MIPGLEKKPEASRWMSTHHSSGEHLQALWSCQGKFLWPGQPPAGRGVLPPCTGDSSDVCMRSSWVGSLWGYVLRAQLVPCLWLVETASGCMWKPLSLSGKTEKCKQQNELGAWHHVCKLQTHHTGDSAVWGTGQAPSAEAQRGEEEDEGKMNHHNWMGASFTVRRCINWEMESPKFFIGDHKMRAWVGTGDKNFVS